MSELDEKVRFLSRPDTYGPGVESVEVLETHMSWVFLTACHVYKLKKPVTNPHLDFSTVEKRRRNCELEVRLNRRLAKGVYLGIVALRRNAGGLALEGAGEIVDWLVKMNRLPDSDMLDHRIAAGRLARADVEKLGDLLAGFFARTPPETDASYLEHLAREQPINRSVLEQPELGFRESAAPLLDALDTAIERLHPALEARIAAGGMVEGHGDLRPEHVYLNDTPKIIDCLEFNRRMRIIDPFDEVNYLGLECEMEGAAWIRPVLLEILGRRIEARPEPAVMALYGTFRALMRARLSAAHLLETPIRKPHKWAPQTFRYLRLAEREAVNLPRRADRTAIRSPAGT
ncbi:hypothetical protein C2I36_08565 [Rhodobacteraceae bacterium WD3A24]|nr:hypothetical protein C2I36_08565 [Rhodobacteraceae bacterium WD3A24]